MQRSIKNASREARVVFVEWTGYVVGTGLGALKPVYRIVAGVMPSFDKHEHVGVIDMTFTCKHGAQYRLIRKNQLLDYDQPIPSTAITQDYDKLKQFLI